MIFLVIKKSYSPAWYDIVLQLFYLLTGYYFLFSYKIGINIKSIFWKIFVYQLIGSILMQIINFSVYGDLYGYNPIDADLYRDYGYLFKDKTLIEALVILFLNGSTIDDFGYPIIVYFSTILMGDNFLYFLVILNAIVIAAGSSWLFKLSSIFVPNLNAYFVALLWGIMPYAIYTTGCGLKENFFVFFVILSIYYLYQYIKNKHYYNLLLFVLFSFFVLLFRLVLGYALILSFLIYIVFNLKIVRQNYKKFIILSVIISVLSFKVLTDYILDQRGYEYDALADNTEEKVGGLVGYLTNYIAGFIGPFPNFVSKSPEKLTYITRYSFTPFFKMMISFYFWYALYDIIKNKKIIFFPMIALYVVNIIMLIFTFFTLHDRYQWPHIPVFILLSSYGFMQAMHQKRIKRLYSLYVFVVLCMIIIFNLR